MAKLTDLPAELVCRIINEIVRSHWGHITRTNHLHDTNHRGVGDIQQRPRAHLEYKDNTPSTRSEYADRRNSNTQRINRIAAPQSAWPERLPSNPLLPLCLVNRIFRRTSPHEMDTDWRSPRSILNPRN
ncbi:hypothetical protein H4Q26_007522 [Puccinia striiformis f. sp. tritici PST-130]|nr:hypothetical protein H4Q26_007522 [Puccinia striiformis f. sp. tritici PST-130]